MHIGEHKGRNLVSGLKTPAIAMRLAKIPSWLSYKAFQFLP